MFFSNCVLAYSMIQQPSMEVKVMQGLNRAVTIKTNMIRRACVRLCARAGGCVYGDCTLSECFCPGSVFIVMLKQECRCCCVMKVWKTAAVSSHLCCLRGSLFIYGFWSNLSCLPKPSELPGCRLRGLSNSVCFWDAAEWNWKQFFLKV